LSAHGAVVSNGYVYPTGYLATHVEGVGRGGRDVFRLEAVIRSMGEADVRAIRKAI